MAVEFKDIFGSLATVGSGIFDTLAGNRLAERAEDRAWERQTAYNHPLEQRKRLEQAGLNPALMYSTPPQNVQSPTVLKRNPVMMQQAVLQNRLTQSQANNLDSQTRLNKIEADISQPTKNEKITNFLFRKYFGDAENIVKNLGNAILEWDKGLPVQPFTTKKVEKKLSTLSKYFPKEVKHWRY